MTWYACLIAYASDPLDPAALAIAGVLSEVFERNGAHSLPLPGLNGEQTHRMLARWFPRAEAELGPQWRDWGDAPGGLPREDELDDLIALLNEHADPVAGTAEEADYIAHVLAYACLGQNHLWQDLHMPSRRELSALIAYWFPSLAAKNSGDMKWKKFFYKQLCEREGLFICKAPSCSVCCDYQRCFGPE